MSTPEQTIFLVRSYQYEAINKTPVPAYGVTELRRSDGTCLKLDESSPLFPETDSDKTFGLGLVLSHIATDRLFDFYERTHVNTYPAGSEYDCFGFATYVAGAETDIKNGTTVESDYSMNLDERVTHLAEGRIYGIYDSDRKCVHAMIGGMHPDANLSVIGAGGLLTYMQNCHSLTLFDGQGIIPFADFNGRGLTAAD